MNTPSKPRFPRSEALAVVRELLPFLLPSCEPGGPDGKPWLKVAGSLRRERVEVGDVEFVYVAAFGEVQDGLFFRQGNLFDAALEGLLARGVLAKRRNSQGSEMWGESNKLALHVASGVPIDFFATKTGRFFNYLVCRTGGKDNNTQIAMAAQNRGLKWHPYHGGFEVRNCDLARDLLGDATLYTGKLIPARTEEDVYALAGLPFLPPNKRP
jgi:DNA polymerase/3'-5' exonuclease PolX